jgi:hypothetical protein
MIRLVDTRRDADEPSGPVRFWGNRVLLHPYVYARACLTIYACVLYARQAP